MLPISPRLFSDRAHHRKSLPIRLKETIAYQAGIPKALTTYTDINPDILLRQVRLAPRLQDIEAIVKNSLKFNEECPLIPSIYNALKNVKSIDEFNKLIHFLSLYLKTCEMGEILSNGDALNSISERCKQKMEHVPFSPRLKIRFREFYAEQLLDLFSSEITKSNPNQAVQRYSTGFQWFTDFNFLAASISKRFNSLSISEKPQFLKLLFKMALYSPINEAALIKIIDPLLKHCLYSAPYLNEVAEKYRTLFSRYSLESIREGNLPIISMDDIAILEFFDITPKEKGLRDRRHSLSTYCLDALREGNLSPFSPGVKEIVSLDTKEKFLNKEIAQTISYSRILNEMFEKRRVSRTHAKWIAQDLKTRSISYLKSINLADFCRVKKGVNWLKGNSENFNAICTFASRELKTYGRENQLLTARFILQIAYQTYKLHDFQSASALIFGLNDFNDEDLLSITEQKKLTKIRTLFHLKNQYQNLRQKMQKLDQKKINYLPFLPLVQKQVEMIDSGNPDHVKNYINFPKFNLICDVFLKFIKNQKAIDQKQPYITDIVFELSRG